MTNVLRWSVVALARRWWLVALGIVVGAGIGYGVASLLPVEYRSTATVWFRTPAFDAENFGTRFFYSVQDPGQVAATNYETLRAPRVARLTATALGERTTERDVIEAIDIRSRGQSGMFDVTATASAPRRAAVLALTWVNQYIVQRRGTDELRYRAAVDSLARRLRSLPPAQRRGAAGVAISEQIGDLQVMSELLAGNVELLDFPPVPESPSTPSEMRLAGVGGLGGFLIGFLAALALEARRARRPAAE